MIRTPRNSRRRPGAVRAAVLGVWAAGALSLAGCSGDGTAADAAGDAKATATATSGTKEKSGAKADTTADKPDAKASEGPGGADKAPADPPAASKSPASAATPPAGGDDGADDCDHKMPISPDEIAVYRYTPEGGFLSLIVKHGNWGCGTPDSDGAPFETVGKETFIPLDQAADITVTNPVVESTENQPIGVQEFLDWLEDHPDSGLVFTYHLGADGSIDRLDEVFTP
ncbi:hypothetical protein [Streptomyces scabiei]|uniref:hypothetical protein n=1 Tax=Streptomyces scabiei TaxID=1930 RepID=UPI001B32982C|nr:MULTISPECIES: hypothetical protein [Streptomyces]MBP5889322.1 hypothetical protein [Streptomyces sp. LBUM 1481]MBP5919348.1 hypothetical protein [Streptomyces sp. LBUM 1483]MDX2686440.1 hypothetical protein [Streptomyces scabiei]MDX2751017.1 hypothetical protein [Streptomyces scabiei]MDX2805275.1 hypothetical protein [Streptomyces scabiei]